VPSQDPEVLNPKSSLALGIMDVGVGPRRLGDMKASSFWIILCLVSVLVIGVTVGGAVGGSIAARTNHPIATVTQSPPTR